MPATNRIAGVVGALGLIGCSAGFLMPATARADACSGIMCMFSSRSTPPAAAPQQPAPAADVAHVPATAEATDAGPKDKPKPKPHPVPVVTIAAGPTEVAKLRALAGVMQKPRVKIVEAKDDAAADFAVTTPLNRDGGIEKARLFTEQLHVLAGAKVRSLVDLKGKVVSFGTDHSPGQAAARKAFEALDIKVAETPLDLDNALDGLATGDIDAVVVLAPQPDPRLKKIKASGLHLVAWPEHATPPEGATTATIDAGAYPGLAKPGDKVAALGIDAVLTLSPKGERQPVAKAFLGALSQHSAALSKKGFDLIKADLASRAGRRVANAEAR